MLPATEKDLSDLYGSRMMSGSELGDRKVRAVISEAGVEELQGRNPGEKSRKKVVLSLRGYDKRVALNSTNVSYLKDKLGKDPQKWVGTELGISAEPTSFGGKSVLGLRVKVLNGAADAPKPAIEDTFNDDITF